jgi:hypothetical protein
MRSTLKHRFKRFHAGIGLGIALCAFLLTPCETGFAQSAPEQTASVETDRWLEIDLYWFKQQQMANSVREFWDRFQPLFAGVRGYRGVILNIGWTVGPVMEWSGNLDQRISLPTGSGQSRWVDEHGPLTGTTEERKKKSQMRFSGAAVGQRRGYDPWTYGDVKALSAALKQEGSRRDVANLKVGILNYAWTNAYGEEAPWVRRHPEAFSKPAAPPNNFDIGRYFDPAAHLHADPRPLGGLPHGIAEGIPVHQTYAAQWGSLSRTLGLDAIMLRDSFGTPVPYQRAGPWGALAPSPNVIQQATDAVAALVKEAKLANPNALVMMYSNAASAVGDWRCNGMDLESIANQGYLDIWVDQTWAGAWNEVGIREGSFWNAPTKGWTYQLAYMLTHAAILANSKVRHYPLVETFDAWESWDVIHSAPERLRWGIWAYSHAAVKTPHGLKMPAGTYISWANQGERLLSDPDVRFLTDNINAAVTDAQETKEIFGPTLVYSRAAMQWQIEHAKPDHDVNEWIDEQLGSVVKWPVPMLSAARVEWLGQIQSDLPVIQSPSHLSTEDLAGIQNIIASGRPVVLLGSFSDGIDEPLLQFAGLQASKAPVDARMRVCNAAAHAQDVVRDLPAKFNVYCQPSGTLASPSTQTFYVQENSPALTLASTKGRSLAAWDAPNLRSLEGVPLSQIWGNAGEPYALAAGVINLLLKSNSGLHVDQIDLNETMNISAWRTANGGLHILAGNLEEGLRDDADMSRKARLTTPQTWLNGRHAWKDAWSGREFHAADNLLPITLPQASSVLLVPSD